MMNLLRCGFKRFIWTITSNRLARLYDFEGRCSQCAKPLNLYLRRLSDLELTLRTEECPNHPGSAVILWPQRDDIIEE